MLAESHPLYAAEIFLKVLFEKAPKDHWIEFRAIVHDENRQKLPHLKPVLLEACQVATLEKSFDLTLSNWILEQNKKGYEIFFGVCPRAILNRNGQGHLQAGKADHVTHAVAAWVDLDNRGWAEILKRYQNLKPSIVISSGNGAHIYFRYSEPVAIGAAVEHSKELAKILGGDTTSDAPRILRVPCTKNCKAWPELKPCEIVSIEDVFFDPVSIPKTGSSDEGFAVSTSDFVSKLPADLRNVIWGGYTAAGRYGDNLVKPGDRSEIDFRVMKELFRYGAPKNVVREIFTNPENGISGKVLSEAKAGNAEHYLDHSMEKALNRAEAEAAFQEEIYGDLLPLTDVRDLGNAQPLRFCVKGLLPIGGMMFVSGPAKAGKSLMVSDLILLLAGIEKGGRFLDRFLVEIPGKVLYLQAEVSKSSLRSRLAQLAESHNGAWNKTPHEIRFFNKPLDLANPRNQGALAGALRKFEPQYLIIDPLARFHYSNENRQSDMSKLLGSIERISRNAGLMGTIIVHHHGKPSEANEREGINSIRGSSVIGDWGNAHLILKKMKTERDQKFVRLNFELRDAEEPSAMDLMRDENLRYRGYSEDGDNEGAIRTLMLQLRGQPEDLLIKAIASDLSTSRDKARQALSRIKTKDRLSHPENSGSVEPVRREEMPEDPTQSGEEEGD